MRALQASLVVAFAAGVLLWVSTPVAVDRALASALLVEQWVVPVTPLVLVTLVLLWCRRAGAGAGAAVVIGSIGLVASAWAAVDARHDVGYAGPAGLVAAAALALVYGAIAASAFAVVRRLGAGGRGPLVGGAIALTCVFLAFLLAPVFHGLHGGAAGRLTANGQWALGTVRVLVACAEDAVHAAPDGGYPPDAEGLAKVCPEARGWLAQANRGYRLSYAPKPGTGSARVAGFELTARPVCFGRTADASLLADETGVVRQTLEDRPARADDPPR
jgi:hypothetical protein